MFITAYLFPKQARYQTAPRPDGTSNYFDCSLASGLDRIELRIPAKPIAIPG